MGQAALSEGTKGRNEPGSRASTGVPVQAILAQLDKILANSAFSHSGRISRFLRFTVEETLEGRGEEINEYKIGLEVFDRNESYDPRIDPIVRVEAGRLRSKLREFYSTDGVNDRILIKIQKGSYVPVFEEPDLSNSTGARVLSRMRRLRDGKTLALLTTAAVAILALYQGAELSRQNRSLQRQLQALRPEAYDPVFAPIWGRFFSPDSQNFVVFGSPVFFSAEGNKLFLRLGTVNEPRNPANESEFSRLRRKFGPLSGPRYDYALMGDAMALQRLTAFFGRAGVSLRAVPAHLATWETISNGNIIFLGAVRMNPLLQRLPVQRNFEWDPDHDWQVVNRNPQPGEPSSYMTPSHWDQMTYAVIASLPGLRPKRRILLVSAHSAPGTIAAVEYVTRIESVRAMNEKMQLSGFAADSSYELLLRVFVDKGTVVKSEYVTDRTTSNSPESHKGP